MKAADIDIGESYAFAEGSGDADLLEKRVTKVEAVRAPVSGRVEVRLLEDGKTRVATSYDQPMPVVGDIRKVKTRQIAMPWSRFEVRLKNIGEQRAAKQKEESRKANRLRRIQERLDRVAPTAGPHHHGLARLGSWDENEITLPTDQLERLLAAAEPN